MKPSNSRTLPVLLIATSLPALANAQTLSVTESGVGPISATSKFNQQTIQKLLPGYAVKAGKRATESEAYRVFMITEQGATLATINPDGDDEQRLSGRGGTMGAPIGHVLTQGFVSSTVSVHPRTGNAKAVFPVSIPVHAAAKGAA